MTVIVLDSGPLGLLAQRPGIAIADSCRAWFERHLQNGILVRIPEIADYETRRELIRLNNAAALSRLDTFCNAPGRYLPINTIAMRKAAEFWAECRRKGLPTSDPKELDADVIVAAQAATSGFTAAQMIVATTNPVHLRRFVNADLWTNI